MQPKRSEILQVLLSVTLASPDRFPTAEGGAYEHHDIVTGWLTLALALAHRARLNRRSLRVLKKPSSCVTVNIGWCWVGTVGRNQHYCQPDDHQGAFNRTQKHRVSAAPR